MQKITIFSNCRFIDNWGNFWIPNTYNVMSYTNLNCMSYFSPLQVGKMYGYISWIGIDHLPISISGSSALCSGQIENYTTSTVAGATSYYWEVSNNYQIINGQGTATVTVKAMNDYGGTISVTPNCGTKKAKKTITSLGELPISGYDQACPLFTYTYKAPFLSNADYEWSITNGYIVSGQYDHEVVVLLSSHSSNQSVLNVEITNHCTTVVYGQKIITHGDPPFPEEQCFTPHPGKSSPIENTFDENNILIYPNPAESSVTVLNITDMSFRIMVMDVTGRIILDFPANSERETQINTAGLPAGVYLIKFVNESGNLTKKLIIKN